MTMYVDTSCTCCLCTRVDHMDVIQDAERWTRIGAWEFFVSKGWQRNSKQHYGGHMGWNHVCPVCSAKPDLIDRLRKRLKLETQE